MLRVKERKEYGNLLVDVASVIELGTRGKKKKKSWLQLNTTAMSTWVPSWICPEREGCVVCVCARARAILKPPSLAIA